VESKFVAGKGLFFELLGKLVGGGGISLGVDRGLDMGFFKYFGWAFFFRGTLGLGLKEFSSIEMEPGGEIW
jgi:hypothetical protein